MTDYPSPSPDFADADGEITNELHNGGSESPTDAPVPYWLTACIRCAPEGIAKSADKALTIAQLLMGTRIRAGSDDVEPDRNLIALFAGSQERWARELVRFLTDVGFLEISKRYMPGTGKRLADTFRVFPSPPPEYVGPRTLAELAYALTAGTLPTRWESLFTGRPQNRRSEPTGTHMPVGVEPYRHTHAGRPQNRRSEPTGTHMPVGVEPYRHTHAGRPQNRRSEPTGTRMPVASIDKRERESSSSLSTDRARVTPDPCGGSVDALSGDAAPEVVEFVVNGIPWDDFPGPRQPLTEDDVKRLALAVASALNEGATFDELARIASEALPRSSASPVAYLIGAFTTRLAHWRGRLNVVRVIGQDHPDPAPVDTSAPPPSLSPAPRVLPACDTCGAREGDPLGTRSITVEGPDGALSAKPCTECRPNAA